MNKLATFLRTAVPTPTGTELGQDELRLQHSRTRYGFLVNANGAIIDDCLFTFFSSPFSYTGEDTLEISSHGNPFISSQIHALLRHLGMRDAGPGEFTQRAYLNGKLDLTRAEAIDQLIHAETAAGIELARMATSGTISNHTRELREQLVSIMAYFEAHIDFAEDEVGSYDAESQKQQLETIYRRIKSLSESYTSGIKMREGLRVVFIGEPNAGKSSLYNSLLGAERAIVTDIPGTTRDIVEDRLHLNGRDFVLLDTAGVRETEDEIEKIGVERTLSSAKDADLICYVIDPTKLTVVAFETQLEQKISNLRLSLQDCAARTELIILTKSDLWSTDLQRNVMQLVQHSPSVLPSLTTCSSHHSEMIQVKRILETTYDAMLISGRKSDSPILISQRQRDKALLALLAVNDAIEMVSQRDYPEKIASTLVLASQHLTELVGEIGTEDVLANIFSTFCIGK